jgi:hypothetical protein
MVEKVLIVKCDYFEFPEYEELSTKNCTIKIAKQL